MAGVQFNPAWSATASYSYNIPDGSDADRLRKLTPRHTTDLALTYSDRIFGKPVTVTALNHWGHDYSSSIKHNLRTDLNFRLGVDDSLDVELQVVNLFDRNNKIASAQRLSLPAQGFAVNGSVVVRFDD